MVRLAIKEAKKSKHRHKLGAVLLKGSRIYARGHNVPCKHVSRSLVPMRYRVYPTSLHAEVAAVLALERSPKGLWLVVVRIGHNDELRDSYPCPKCLGYLKAVGIRRVIYTTNSGEVLHQIL